MPSSQQPERRTVSSKIKTSLAQVTAITAALGLAACSGSSPAPTTGESTIDHAQTMKAIDRGSYAKITLDGARKFPRYLVYTAKSSVVAKRGTTNLVDAIALSLSFAVLVENN